MSVDQSTLEHIARLAKIALTSDEKKIYTEKFNQTLEVIRSIDDVNVEGIEPMAHVFELHQAMRPDVITEKNQQAEILASAPLSEAGLYLVSKVIE